MKYVILTGTVKEVENKLNSLNDYNHIIVCGLSTTNELTTIVVEVISER